MGKVLYSAAMSLDGFIAGPGGDAQWMTGYLGPNPEVDDLVPGIGALLVGRRTYGGDDPNRGTEHEGAFGGTWHGPQFVVTHRPAEPAPGVTFVGDVVSAVAAAKEAAGDKYVTVLGAEVARGCLDAGLLDEILVAIVPVLLGDGVRLFERPGGDHVRLERLKLTEAPTMSNLWLRVVR
ncbi:dihydrofolate reductase family protein [Amycolatopsis sp. FDAARGOS 1241]|uniref:dihydrofolate reductase family protein n=1 Tax=Amycolatopsis sp. FDAARGOS 1241 TaxID=2778070 RepID=UPI00194DD9E9|nr:dihydrofolate reductase family protein [Amycolatopsis sp. FDAARGOS 1241]QRP49830.1 dihydrofolate reductase family protein [Amycolatopsis sp. FDAARGOS 1241]